MKRSAIWIVAGGFLFALGWRVLVMATQYLHGDTITRNLGSLPQFEQDLVPNSDNTRLVFCQDTKEGVGIYFCDMTGGKPRLLCEQKEKGHSWMRFSMLGWSPDNSVFACAFPENYLRKELILIFDGHTGEQLAKVTADNNLSQFGWLSNDSFAYAGQTFVQVVTKQGNGRWATKVNYQKVAAHLDNLAVVSANTVAWRDGDGIWLFNLDSNSREKIWQATTNRLMEFTYAKAANEFLLNCNDEAGQYLLRFDAHDKRTINLGHIGSQPDYIHQAVLNGQGSSYASLTNDPAGSAFCIKTGDMAAPITIPWHGGVLRFALNGGQLFFSGNPDNQPPGIWEYDIKSATFTRVVATTSLSIKDNLGASPVCEMMTNSLGEQRFYHLWAPTHVSPNQKYPVLLAQEFNMWFPHFQIAAHSGYYVAVVDRPFFHVWNTAHERTWAEDVGSLYEIMARNPNIDTNRVYLYACSAETTFLTQLMDARPTLAKGAILFTPTALPDPSILQNKHLLIVDGKTDGDAVKRLSKYQDQAASKGGDITLYFQDAAGHVFASGNAEQNWMLQFARFLSVSR